MYACFFGTNPLAFAAPRPGRSPLVIDMATSATARVSGADIFALDDMAAYFAPFEPGGEDLLGSAVEIVTKVPGANCATPQRVG